MLLYYCYLVYSLLNNRVNIMSRLNKISVDNLMVAEEVQILPLDSGGYMVKVWRKGNASILHAGNDVLTYDDIKKAERAIRRLRPDLRITTI